MKNIQKLLLYSNKKKNKTYKKMDKLNRHFIPIDVYMGNKNIEVAHH